LISWPVAERVKLPVLLIAPPVFTISPLVADKSIVLFDIKPLRSELLVSR
jgi:hypothetical protein